MTKEQSASSIKDVAFEHTNHVSLNDISSQIKLPPTIAMYPRILLAVAPCRSGTTVQLRMFSSIHIPSYYQPLKAILRRQAQGMSGEFEIPSQEKIFIKETLGPYSQAEAAFNPLQVLLTSGYPKDKITLIVELREPLSTLTSWIETELPVRGNRDALFTSFITAYKTIPQILRLADESGIQVVPYLYEAQRDIAPSNAAAHLFSALKLPFRDIVATGWDSLPLFGTLESNIFFPAEPELYSGDFHDVATTSDQLGYTKKGEQSIDKALQTREVIIVEQEGLPQIYDHIRKLVGDVIGIQIQPSTEIDQFKFRLLQTAALASGDNYG